MNLLSVSGVGAYRTAVRIYCAKPPALREPCKKPRHFIVLRAEFGVSTCLHTCLLWGLLSFKGVSLEAVQRIQI